MRLFIFHVDDDVNGLSDVRDQLDRLNLAELIPLGFKLLLGDVLNLYVLCFERLQGLTSS